MKLSILSLIVIIASIFISFGMYYGVHVTSDEKFCVSCHEMEPMVISYKDDVHGGKGKSGASVQCVSCHLPQDNLANYIYTKAKKGIEETRVHFFGDLDKIDWQKKRKQRDRYVYDSACLKCHRNILDNNLVTPTKMALKMHNHYKKLKNTKNQITCASCHFDAGHKNLRTYLNYYKPELIQYRGKLEEKKKEALKKYEKYGIKN